MCDLTARPIFLECATDRVGRGRRPKLLTPPAVIERVSSKKGTTARPHTARVGRTISPPARYHRSRRTRGYGGYVVSTTD